MTEHTLRGCRVLVVEDEFLLADQLRAELEEGGAIVLGPIGSLEDALELIGDGQIIDGAIVDVNLHGQLVYPAADLLLEREVPFVFATGYDASAIPPRFEHIVRFEKPIDMRKVTSAIGRLACES